MELRGAESPARNMSKSRHLLFISFSSTHSSTSFTALPHLRQIGRLQAPLSSISLDHWICPNNGFSTLAALRTSLLSLLPSLVICGGSSGSGIILSCLLPVLLGNLDCLFVLQCQILPLSSGALQMEDSRGLCPL
jgi:hypothetical protein